jgi:hypothetical protein
MWSWLLRRRGNRRGLGLLCLRKRLWLLHCRRRNLADFLLKASQGFPDAFTDLRKATGAENDQDDGQNDDQLGDPHRPEHDGTSHE